MSRRGWMWLTAAATAAVIAIVLTLQEGGAPQDTPGNLAEPGDRPDDAAPAAAAGAGAGGAPGEVAANPAGGDEAPEPAAGSPTRRAWLERAIRIAREERLAGGGSGGAAGSKAGAAAERPEGADEPGSLDPEYIRAAIRDLVPLIRECYELALDEQDDLEGRLVVEFEIAGEEDVGGIVETSEIDDASDLRHPVLDECVCETVYTAELPAPEGGGRVTVRYPFHFSPE